MNKKRQLKLVTANILFGGMQCRHVGEWLYAHYKVLVAQSETFLRQRLKVGGDTIVKDLVNKFSPDILILNEVIPSLSDAVVRKLKEARYNIVMGEWQKFPMSRTTLIASKFRGRKFPFRFPGDLGDGACAFEIPALKTITLAPHPSAFNKRVRHTQLKYIADTIRKIQQAKPDYHIILGGDFNSDEIEMDLFFKELPLTRLSHPSFPSKALYEQLNWWRWSWLKWVMSLRKGQRSIDHFLISRGLKNPQAQVYDTAADHSAIFLQADI